MRKPIGIVVLILGLLLLGFWGSRNQAVDIEAKVRSVAQSVNLDITHPIEVGVSGRDIRVAGLANSQSEKDAILSVFKKVPGHRKIQDKIDVLPLASPFSFRATKDEVGMTFSGNTATEAQRQAFSDAFGGDMSGLVLAAGMPDTNWPAAVAQGYATLSGLHHGELSVADRNISISGLASNPTARDAALASFSGLPDGYTLTPNIDILDDGTPMRLNIVKSAEGIVSKGKLPVGMSVEQLLGLVGGADSGAGIDVANIAGPTADWADMASSATGALASLTTGTLDIRGTDIALIGSATRSGKAGALAALGQLDGAYAVSSDVVLDDDGKPFSLAVDYDGTAAMASGKFPHGMSAGMVAAALGLENADTSGVAIAEIESANGDWPQAAIIALGALKEIDGGTVSLVDNDLTISGDSLRKSRDNAVALLGDLPAAINLSNNITLIDDGAPFAINAEFDGADATVTGKMPFGTNVAAISDALGVPTDTSGISVAEIDAASPQWGANVASGLLALRQLESGSLSINENSVALNGIALRTGREKAFSMLSGLASDVELATDIQFADDGRPFSLNAASNGLAATVDGKLPYGMSLDDVTAAFGSSVSGNVDIAEIESEDGLWPNAAASGMRALAKMQSGSLSIVDKAITLSGTAFNPDERDTALAEFTGLGADYTVNSDRITLLDDGLPPAFGLSFNAASGASLTGKLPKGLTAPAIADLLNLESIQSSAQEGLIGAPEAASEAIGNLSLWLPELDSANLSSQVDQLDVSAVVAPGVDPVLVKQGLDETFGQSLDVAALTDLPNVGTVRTNVLSGTQETFSGVAWLPNIEFDTALDVCAQQSQAVLADNQISFVTGKAQLDPKSMRAVNALASIMLKCAEIPGIAVEIAGHTDSVGSASSNELLSQRRASAVLDALLERGVSDAMASATGYGEVRPIAGNETAEGRAKNRRTEINWSIAEIVGGSVENGDGSSASDQ